MQLQEILTEKSINLSLPGKTKDQVLSQLVELLAANGAIRQTDGVIEALAEREGLGSTGIGHGVAIPHCRSSEISSPTLVLGRTVEPVEFDSIDGKPARIFFLLVVPENGNNDHLHMLAKIARLMKGANTREKLLQVDTPQAVLQLIGENEAG